jgi:MinD-like ATPase involved in chromosome partitioning or flagellar assembly
MRVALGLGDQELEWRLRPALDADDQLVVCAQCLSTEQLLHVLQTHQADVAVIATGLHRLTPIAFEQIERVGLPVVLLAPELEQERWPVRHARVLPVDSDATAVRDAILALRRGERSSLVHTTSSHREPLVSPAMDATVPRRATVIAVTGGAGAPGRTTVAINLAAALGSVAASVLVDLDLCSPAVAAYLDRDPTRNICTLAHAVREGSASWTRELADELQPLTNATPSANVLCGPPKPEMRASISPSIVHSLVAELAHCHRYVILDVGPQLLGTDTTAATHRVALGSAAHILFVASSDVVGLWHAATGLKQLEQQIDVPPDSIHLVLNRYDPRHHHPVSEIEWHLGRGAISSVPFDYSASQRALAEQRPLVMQSSRAGRALLTLAERVHASRIRPETLAREAERQSWWRKFMPRAGRVRSNAAPRPGSSTAHGRRGEAW